MGRADAMTQAVSEERTNNYVRQVKGSVVFKGLAIGASFLAVPLMIRYLGQELYGIWSTLLSIMSWVVLFDLGIGNGLRNKLAESLAKNQISDAVGYISSGYTWIGLGSLSIFIAIALFAHFIPWQSVFNTQFVSTATLRNAVLLAAFFVLLNFWLGLINQIFNATQRTSGVVLGQLISNAAALLIVFFLIQTTDASLLCIVAAYGVSMMLANLVLSLWFFNQHGELRPRLSFDPQHIHPLLSVGLQFFIIQIAVLIIFTTDKILITQLFGPQYVTQYDVVFKIFSIITILHGLLTAPLWSAYTDAYHRDDLNWIKGALQKQLLLFMGIVLITIALVLTAKPIIGWWIGSEVEIPSWLVISMGAFIFVSTWNNIFAYLLNGIGDIKLQLFTAVVAMLINIPLSILLVKYFDFGLHGVVWATCLSLSIFAIVGPLQVMLILTAKKPVLKLG
jgi:O-antigen/teichoic acid export membrane protein